MSRRCYRCRKKPRTGHKVSHSNIKTKRKWFPNLQKSSILENGLLKQVLLCAKCLKKAAG